MKILFISNPIWSDYMNDMILHGGKILFGKQFEELNKNFSIYNNCEDLSKLYGKGFTLYGKVDYNLIDDSSNDEQILKIKNKFYDKIIYGSCRRNLSHLDDVINLYGRNEILFIDGEDDTKIDFDLIQFGKYYKRELIYKYNELFPINFSIPQDLIVDSVPKKIKEFAKIIPGKLKTYTFENETEYFKDYQNSWFGLTKKKAGWDCLRHYEILMNGCIPVFKNLKSCPPYTLTKFPKKILMNNKNVKNEEIILELLEFTREHLTTVSLVKNILN